MDTLADWVGLAVGAATGGDRLPSGSTRGRQRDGPRLQTGAGSAQQTCYPQASYRTGELGLADAYIAGEPDVDGELAAAPIY